MNKIYIKIFFLLCLTILPLKSQTLETVNDVLIFNELTRIHSRYIVDVDNFLSSKISQTLPLLSTLGHTDQILSHYSVFGINFGFTGGVLMAAEIGDAQLIERTTIQSENEFFRDSLTNAAGFTVPLLMPYVGFRIRIDSKKNPKPFHPFVISVKYGGTTIIQSSIDQGLTSLTANNPDLTGLSYKVDSVGIQLAFPLWKKYQKDFQLNVTAGYNYLRGEFGTEAEIRFEQDVSILEEVSTISNIRMDLLYNSIFETSSLDVNLNFSASARFINVVFGLGVIVSSTTFFSRYSSTAETEQLPTPITTSDRRNRNVLGILPKINLAIKLFLTLDIAFSVTTQSFGLRVSLVL